MSKHIFTPGPWVIRNLPSMDTYIGPASDGGAPNIAIVPKRISRSAEEQAANAKLIAAAPSLLEACETLLFELVVGPAARDEVIANARAAIQRATGEA